MMHPSLSFIGILKQKGDTQGYRLSQDRILGRKGRRYVQSYGHTMHEMYVSTLFRVEPVEQSILIAIVLFRWPRK